VKRNLSLLQSQHQITFSSLKQTRHVFLHQTPLNLRRTSQKRQTFKTLILKSKKNQTLHKKLNLPAKYDHHRDEYQKPISHVAFLCDLQGFSSLLKEFRAVLVGSLVILPARQTLYPIFHDLKLPLECALKYPFLNRIVI